MASQLYLVHHGIKGQRWGVRRFQNKNGTLTSAGKSRYGVGKPKTHRDRLIYKYKNKGMSQQEAEAAADKRRKIERAIVIGAAVTATALASYGAYQYVKTASAASALSPNRALEGQLKRKAFEAADFDARVDSDLKKINHGLFGNLFLRGRECNCTSCTVAYEMRRRGYDVIADTTKDGRTLDQFESFFKDGHSTLLKMNPMHNPISNESINDVVKTLAKQGNGARGIINGGYSLGGAHSLAYEVHNGKVLFLEPQLGRRYDSAKDAIGNMYLVTAMRTDNLEVADAAATALRNNSVPGIFNEAPNDFAITVGSEAIAIGALTAYSAQSKKKAANNELDEKKKVKIRRRYRVSTKKIP